MNLRVADQSFSDWNQIHNWRSLLDERFPRMQIFFKAIRPKSRDGFCCSRHKEHFQSELSRFIWWKLKSESRGCCTTKFVPWWCLKPPPQLSRKLNNLNFISSISGVTSHSKICFRVAGWHDVHTNLFKTSMSPCTERLLNMWSLCFSAQLFIAKKTGKICRSLVAVTRGK